LFGAAVPYCGMRLISAKSKEFEHGRKTPLQHAKGATFG
jgi:hypothetical protein